MIVSNKFSGWAIITAVLLYFIRFIPIIFSGAGNFPPSTLAGFADLAIVGRRGWELSHLMGLTLPALFFMGYVWLYTELRQREQKNLGLLFIVVMGGALLFQAIAVVMDGFLVPAAANQSGLMAELPAEFAHAFVGFSHEAAQAFLKRGITITVLGIGLVSVALWRAKLLNKWFVAISAGLSGLVFLGLVIGVFGPTRGPLLVELLGINLWQLALGISIVRYKPAGAA